MDPLAFALRVFIILIGLLVRGLDSKRIHSGSLGKVKTFISLMLSFININAVGVTSR